ncbi:Hypothetical protein CINCED_3A013951 [Cinara cedri]|nr:Hypothetical protein CINCED_3A013951 [Cinara cedri]
MSSIINDNTSDEEGDCLDNILVVQKCKVEPFEFNIKKILKERQEESEFWKKNAELSEQIKIVDDLFDKVINQVDVKNIALPIPNLGYHIFDHSKYNILFNNNSDSGIINSYSQRLLIMSIEKNQLQASIHFYHLMQANWTPVLNDFKNILCNWGADLDTLTKPLLKCQINDNINIKRYNFELILDFFSHTILRNNEGFSKNDMLILAKLTVAISQDYYCGQIINSIKQLFSACVVKALHEDSEFEIKTFAQELYLQYEKDDLLQIVVVLFLPLEGPVLKKIYSYLTYKLFNLLLAKSDNIIKSFPSSINDWFIQDLVDTNYLKQIPKSELELIFRLLEHVVFIFNLYKDEDKLRDMFEFLHGIIRPKNGLIEQFPGSLKLLNIIDQWRLQLFRLHVYRIIDSKQQIWSNV